MTRGADTRAARHPLTYRSRAPGAVYRLLIDPLDAPLVKSGSNQRNRPTGGMCMKMVRSLKKRITGEKSLKAYAWYHWY
ncbi:hypothetical protein DMA15_29155 [Streptomyces sp. WAC 01529]|nr:hypothetical protein DMA15_29155 [Streptomyces sp. WAC 01529]